MSDTTKAVFLSCASQDAEAAQKGVSRLACKIETDF
jgi:hypothetical protein